MGATIPARIQPGSIDHRPFPTFVPCLKASLALREKARRRKNSLPLPSLIKSARQSRRFLDWLNEMPSFFSLGWEFRRGEQRASHFPLV